MLMADPLVTRNHRRAKGALERLGQPGPGAPRVFLCADCRGPVGGPYAQCRACLEAETRVHRRELVRGALESIPSVFRDLWRGDEAALTAGPSPRVKEPKAVAAAQRALAKPISAVVLRGGRGRGKTSLAAFLLGRAIMRTVDPSVRFAECRSAAGMLFVTAEQIATARSEHPLGAGEPPLFVRARYAGLLVLDELSDKLPSARLADVERLIHERHSADCKTIVTTPLTAAQIIAHYGETAGRRLGDERTVQVNLGGVP